MRIRELFESQYHSNTDALIRSEIQKLQTALNKFDELVNLKGWQFAENNAKLILQESVTDEWLMIPIINSSEKLKKTYSKLIEVRQRLTEKIKSGL